MARLFKQRITRYLDADGKRVKAGTLGARKLVEKSTNWYGQYRNGKGKRVRVPLCPDKQESRDMLAGLINKARRQRLGLDDPAEEKFAAQWQRPLLEHLADYRRYLESKKNGEHHVSNTIQECKAILDGCKFRQIGDIEESAIVEFLAELRHGEAIELPARKEWFTAEEVADLFGIAPLSVRRSARRGLLASEGKGKGQRFPRTAVEGIADKRRRGLGVETTNHYTRAIKSFTRWLVIKARRTKSDPLIALSLLNADLDIRHARRALSAGDFGLFLDATAAGRPFRSLDGSDRIILYCTAARTGLRASELGSLAPESFDLTAVPATVTVAAAYSKHRRVDILPLTADLLELLLGYLPDKPAGQPVWPGTWKDDGNGAEMVRRDLAAAGIPYADPQGRVLDFHGLRHTFITHLVESGVHPKVAQVLARHSSIKLTMDRYTHLRAVDVAGDLDKLPALRRTPKQEPGTKGEVA